WSFQSWSKRNVFLASPASPSGWLLRLCFHGIEGRNGGGARTLPPQSRVMRGATYEETLAAARGAAAGHRSCMGRAPGGVRRCRELDRAQLPLAACHPSSRNEASNHIGGRGRFIATAGRQCISCAASACACRTTAWRRGQGYDRRQSGTHCCRDG